MFVTISKFRSKVGEEDAIIALHESWQCVLQPIARGYISGELLRNFKDASEFIAIRRFVNQDSARDLANNPEEDAWYRRVVSLTESTPTLTEYTSEWP
jgi:antibiotic biosynthesis monooxygenase (ABM) superfamily enzyme